MEPRKAAIQERIDRMPEGSVFTFASLSDLGVPPQALAVVISRLAKKGVVQRLSKGRYGKPRRTRFGTLFPSDNQLLDSILRPTGQLRGYVSGLAAYNRLGLTNQVPNEIEVAGIGTPRVSKIGKLRIRFVRAKGAVTEQTKDLLPILDALRDSKKIPDTNVDEVLTKLRTKIEQLSTAEKGRLAEAAIGYSPRVRALLGAILESLGEKGIVYSLKSTLNSISSYAVGIERRTLPNAGAWNIR